MQLEVILAGNRIATRVTTKESINTKTENGNCFCIRVVESVKLRLNVMPTNLEHKAKKDREKENVDGRPAKLNEKKSDRDLEREIKKKKKQRRHFLLEELHENFVAAVTK